VQVQAEKMPQLRTLESHTQLLVDGAPFLMVAGELHNSSASAPDYFRSAMQHAKAMNINTVIVPIAWEQLEPQEGVYDFDCVDFILEDAEAMKLKIVLLWFGSWKNGESSYVPLWVKTDTKRFFRAKTKDGEKMTAISPFCEEAMKADAKAFAALMKYIKEEDDDHTIIMVQVENEAGLFSEMDFTEIAQKKYNEQVPSQLVEYLVAHQETLEKELKTAWLDNGAKKKGTWAELFGEKNHDARNFFLSWQYAGYINEVCKAGKQQLPLPMYVNAWLVDGPAELPGKYPNGGPVSRVMDIYKLAAPDIDFLSPDVYAPNFREVCALYDRTSKKNPLFVPECERRNPGKAYYVFAEHNALGFAPFGVESLVTDDEYALSFKLLKDELLPLIIQYQGSGKMKGVLKEGDEESATVKLDPYTCHIQFMDKKEKAYGIVVKIAEDEFLVAGRNLKVAFSSNIPSHKTCIGQVLEGGFKDGEWHTTRRLNGDENKHNKFLLTKGRAYESSIEDGQKTYKQILVPLAYPDQELESDLRQRQIKSPGIYKVKLYQLQ
jgi:beta-galactosidase GanA